MIIAPDPQVAHHEGVGPAARAADVPPHRDAGDEGLPALRRQLSGEGEGLFAFPQGTYTLGRAPYMEASVGIENIFKVMRIDYVWRMTYRDNPGIQRRGVRMTMSLSF